MPSFKNGVYKMKRECDKCLMTLKDVAWLQTEKTPSKVTFLKNLEHYLWYKIVSTLQK